MEIAMFIMTKTSSLVPLEAHHLPNNSAADIFYENIEDLWNLHTIVNKEPNKLEDYDSISQALKDSIIKKNGRYELTSTWKEKAQILLAIMTSAGRLKSAGKF